MRVSLWLPGILTWEPGIHREHPSSESKTLAGPEGRTKSVWGSPGLGALLGQGSWVSAGRCSHLSRHICQSNAAGCLGFSYTFTDCSHGSETVVFSLPSAPAMSPGGIWLPLPWAGGAVSDAAMFLLSCNSDFMIDDYSGHQ